MSTPMKKSSKNARLCIVCAKCPNSPRKIESEGFPSYSTKMTHNLQNLLLKYGGINVDYVQIMYAAVYNYSQKSVFFPRTVQTKL